MMHPYKKSVLGLLLLILVFAVANGPALARQPENTPLAAMIPLATTTTIASDDFSSGDYAGGGSGWIGDWTEMGENDGPNAGFIQVVSEELVFSENNRSLYRTVNLSGAAAATLSVDTTMVKVNRTYYFLQLFASTDGGATWDVLALETERGNYQNPATADFTNTWQVNIPPKYFVPALTLRFSADYRIDAGKSIKIDNVEIAATKPDAGDITGLVFKDYAYDNEAITTVEVGLPGVIVNAIDEHDISTSVTTDAAGLYVIPASAGLSDEVRLEFRYPANGSLDEFENTIAGGTSVQFVDLSAGSVIANMGLQWPFNNSTGDVDMLTTQFVVGPHDDYTKQPIPGDPPTPGVDFTGEPAVLEFPFGAIGKSASQTGYVDTITRATHAQTGATYGVAINRDTEDIFVSASIKRASDFGPAGPGGIYRITAAGSVTTYATIPNAGTDPHDFSGDFTTISYDTGVRGDYIGKMSLGDMEISPDRQTLYVVNLNDGHLYSLPANSGTVPVPAGQITDEGLIAVPGCITGDFHPYGLGYGRDGQLYIGAVCGDDSGTSADGTEIYVLNTLNTTVFQEDGLGITLPWTSGASGDFDDQLMFADVDFADGDLILNFRDRDTDQSYTPNLNVSSVKGEMYKACWNAGSTQWELEENGECGGVVGDQATSNFFDDRDGVFGNRRATYGSTAQVNGYTMAHVLDPIDLTSGGPVYLDSGTGRAMGLYEVYWGWPTAHGLFGKTAGLGDMEALLEDPPLQVGNRIWDDTDGDGQQDPGEPGIGGVTVALDCGGSAVTATTASVDDTNTPWNEIGQYLFTDTDNAPALTPGADCQIIVDTTQGALSAFDYLSIYNSGTFDGSNDPRTDLLDSDAYLDGNDATINFTAAPAGEINHSFDIGFTAVEIDLDLGDLPDGSSSPSANFLTRKADNGAAHQGSDDLFLGTCMDVDGDGQPDPLAGSGGSGGDDNDGSSEYAGSCTPAGADEDGVTLVTPLVPGEQACVAVTAMNTSGGAANLYGWIDFNGNGAFEGDEALTGGSGGSGGNFSGGTATVANNYTGSNTYCFQVPADATYDGGQAFMRFRLTTDTIPPYAAADDTPWGGTASDGEVEDYYEALVCLGNYLWLDSGSAPNSQDTGDAPVTEGTAVDLVWGGPDGLVGGANAADDVTYNTTTGAEGIYHFCGVLPDANGDTTADEYQIIVPVSPATPVTPNVGGTASDSNGIQNGDASESEIFTVSIPTGVSDNAPNDNDPNNHPNNQTDLSIDFGFNANFDFGDLPDAAGGSAAGNPYPTLLEHDGARHVIAGSAYLGSIAPDSESDGQPDSAAAGDDLNDTSGSSAGNDEDGVVFLTPLLPNKTANIQVTIADADGSACLSAFIDFDGNGSLDLVSYTAVDSSGPGGTLGDLALSSGVHTITISVPGQAGGNMPARFRLTDACGQGGNSANGSAADGEVEDYILATISDFVWGDTNYDGLQNEGAASGINGVTVSLLDGNGNPVNDAAGNPIQIVTMNDGSANPGWYTFPGLPPGDYQVGFDPSTANPSYAISPRDQGSDDALDSDADVVTGKTQSISLAAGETNTSTDAGLYLPANPAVGNRVWFDLNGNAVMDNNEVGIGGATVTLRQDTGPDGPDATDPIRATILSDGEGYYLFANATPGTAFFVCVDLSTTGYPRSSKAPWGPPSATEEDQANGDDGIHLFNPQVCSQVFDIAVGGMPTDDLVTPVGYANDSADMKIDFGFTTEPLAVGLGDFFAAGGGFGWPVVIFLVMLFLVTGLVLLRKNLVPRKPGE